jgi:hypothetical protein
VIENRRVNGRFVIDQEIVAVGKEIVRAAAIYEVVNGRIRRVWFAS